MRQVTVKFRTKTISSPMMISASIIKDGESKTADFCNLTLYNLASETRSLIVENETKVFVYAGYEVESLIFTGDIQFAQNTKNNNDWITNVLAGDGAMVLQSALFNKTYTEPVTVRDILNDASRSFEGGLLEILGETPDILMTRGATFSDKMGVALDNLSKTIDSAFSIQDDRLVVSRGSRPLGYTIDVKTGMIDTPEWINTGNDIHKIKVKSRLIPSIKPFDRVKIKSDFVSTTSNQKLDNEFTVIRVEHVINSREGDFMTVIEANLI